MLPTTSSSSSPSSTTSTSTKTNHVDIDVLSTHIESLRQRMSPIMKSPTPTNGEKPSPRHLPSKIELLFRDFQETSMEILASLSVSPSPRRAASNLNIPFIQTSVDLTRYNELA